MTKKEFISAIGKGKPFNTNNAWGFGGASGMKYSFNGCAIFIGKSSYRHSPCSKYFRVDFPSNEFFTGIGMVRKEPRDFESLIYRMSNWETDDRYISETERIKKYNNN